jgi:hypothetical protein
MSNAPPTSLVVLQPAPFETLAIPAFPGAIDVVAAVGETSPAMLCRLQHRAPNIRPNHYH